MVTLTSGVSASDAGCPWYYLSPSYMLMGTLRRCLDQTLSILCPGVMTSRLHSANGNHSQSLMTAEVSSPIAVLCAEMLTQGRLPQDSPLGPSFGVGLLKPTSGAPQTFLTLRRITTQGLGRGGRGRNAIALVHGLHSE